MDLNDIRREIDAADKAIAEAFQRRAGLSAAAALYKREHGLPMVDGGRERGILLRAEEMTGDPAMKPAVRRLFEQVLTECRAKQLEALSDGAAEPVRPAGGQVAFLGPEGSFSHDAAIQYFGADMRSAPAASFEEAVEAVVSGACAFGMLPVENSLAGGVFPVVDILAEGRLYIVGEAVLAVRHCLLGLPGASAGGVKAVLSHAQPLEQCRKFLRRMGYMPQACASTADAARRVAALGDPAFAAIASEAAGQMHGLVPLMRDIQDNPANYTRFAVVSASEQYDAEADKISAMFIVEHRPGTLYGVLRAFADRGINLLNLVSRPVQGSPWQYSFHMDFDGSLADGGVQEALRDAGGNCRSIRILGNYRKWRGGAT